MAAPLGNPTLHAVQPIRAEPSAELGCTFSSVLCAVDRRGNDQAARRQAALLASPGGTVELCSASELTGRGHRSLHHRCEGHELLVLGAGAGANAAVQHTPIPVLMARWCPIGTEVADTILVAVDGSPESSRGVELGGRLAAAHEGTVTVLAAPGRDTVFERALAASARILLQATGASPRVVGNQLPPERSIPAAAAALDASLVVLGCGSSESARRMTAHIAGLLRCSLLAVVAPRPTPATKAGASDHVIVMGSSDRGQVLLTPAR